MTISHDLFLAILSMDSYNRGYLQSIKEDRLGGSRLGNASITQDSRILGVNGSRPDITSGFYAIAYEIDGAVVGLTVDTKVIMYRGSDTFLPSPGIGGDVRNGYGVAVGQYDGPQARLAMQFYNAVTGRSPADGPNTSADVIVSGHSLGAGLAGLIGTLTRTRSVLFDPMPFDFAAQNAYLHALLGGPLSVDDDGNEIVRAFTAEEREFITNLYGNPDDPNFDPWLPTKSMGVTGAYIPHAPGRPQTNFLDWSRSLGVTVTATEGLDPLELPDDTPLSWTNRNRVGQRHANTLIVMRMFGELLADKNWEKSTRFWMPALFDGRVGDAAGGAAIDNTGSDPSGAMQNAIAYSAIAEGVRPFGDTGIWSMFNDASDLGRSLTGSTNPFFDATVTVVPIVVGDQVVQLPRTAKEWLADLLVQYAGALAINDVETLKVDGTRNRIRTSAGDVDPTEGVLGLRDNVLSVDLSSVLWEEVLGGNKVDPLDAVEFRDAFFRDAADNVLDDILDWLGIETADELARRFYGAKDGSVIDRFGMVIGNQLGGTFTIAERTYANTIYRGDNTHVDVFVATKGNDIITGTKGNDILAGHGGKDRIDAKEGNDIVFARKGQESVTIGGLFGCGHANRRRRGRLSPRRQR